MRWRMPLLGLLVASPLFAQATPENDWTGDEATLREHQLPTQGPALLQLLRERTPSPESIKQFHQLVARLKAATYPERIKSTRDLTRMGPVVRPLLENHLLDVRSDPETSARLRHILEQFPAEKDHAIVTAAARLIVRDQPADSLRVLLDFVPYATDEGVRQATQRAINAAALHDKKPSPLLRDALNDANPARQAAAAEALLQSVGLAAKEDIAPLLKSRHPLVRYQLGLALTEKHDKSGLPLLIEVLPVSPSDRVDHALELLYRAAGDSPPDALYRGKADARRFSEAWMKWHEQNEGKLDLAKNFARGDLGRTVICSTGLKVNTKNKIYELGPDQAVQWEFDGPRYPVDLQILAANRLLIAEYFDRRVTERDFKGNLLWQVSAMMPIACQRLPNGHTFIATRQQLLVVDREGKEVTTCFQQNTSITTAQRLRNGQMVVVTTGGRCHLLDPQGREIKSFQMGPIYTLGGNIEILSNQRILAPQYSQNCIVEFDWQGNKLWQAAVNRPISVTRLTNGHTLVTCSLDYRVVEIDAHGREVWSCQTEGRPFRARRR